LLYLYSISECLSVVRHEDTRVIFANIDVEGVSVGLQFLS
jgi:hypothetical protein